MEQEEKFSDDPLENLKIENELLRIKLKAQYGDAFHMESGDAMPPEIENQFLKNILTFEAQQDTAEYTTVYDRIGKPEYKSAEELTPQELKIATAQLLGLLAAKQMSLDFSNGPYPDEIIYKFITEEFFAVEVLKEPLEGMVNGFIYEEFHPNHKAAVERLTHKFLKEWFTRNFSDEYAVLSNEIITADRKQLTSKQLCEKLRIFFDAFKSFDNDGYNIDSINFDLQPGGEQGFGFAEGMLKYDAAIDNGESIHFQGPYKIYMQWQYDCWSVFYFVMPGFNW